MIFDRLNVSVGVSVIFLRRAFSGAGEVECCGGGHNTLIVPASHLRCKKMTPTLSVGVTCKNINLYLRFEGAVNGQNSSR